jgi:hypothetical protein
MSNALKKLQPQPQSNLHVLDSSQLTTLGIIPPSSSSPLPLSLLSPLSSGRHVGGNGDDQRRKPRIVIIGGGVSGLACARSLVFGAADAVIGAKPNDDIEVIVIEARSRLGGRIHSVTLPSSSNATATQGATAAAATTDRKKASSSSKMESAAIIDVGASWVHGMNGNPISMLSSPDGKRCHLTFASRDDVGGPNNYSLFCDINGRIYDGTDIEVIEVQLLLGPAQLVKCCRHKNALLLFIERYSKYRWGDIREITCADTGTATCITWRTRVNSLGQSVNTSTH